MKYKDEFLLRVKENNYFCTEVKWQIISEWEKKCRKKVIYVLKRVKKICEKESCEGKKTKNKKQTIIG